MAHFKYVEFITSGQNLLADLKEQITGFTGYPFNAASTPPETETTNAWTFISEVTDVSSGKMKELTLETTAKIGTTTPVSKKFQVKFSYEGFSTIREHSSLTVQVLDGFSAADQSYTSKGHPVNYEWADEEYKDGTTYTDRDKTKPVYVYMNITNNRLAICLVGDPTVHFNDYRKSFLYVGTLKPFKYNEDDVAGNVMLTAGAEKAEILVPSAPEYNFGQYTSFGNNTVQMLATKSGIKYQKHYPAFISQAPTPGKAYIDSAVPNGIGDTGLLLEPQGFNASAWTRKYHLSPIYIVHPYDGYRGQFIDCIAVSKNNILHLDELIVDIDEGTPGKTWKQEVYRYFDHNTKQNFMNRSANVRMGVAFLKEVRY